MGTILGVPIIRTTVRLVGAPQQGCYCVQVYGQAHLVEKCTRTRTILTNTPSVHLICNVVVHLIFLLLGHASLFHPYIPVGPPKSSPSAWCLEVHLCKSTCKVMLENDSMVNQNPDPLKDPKNGTPK